MRFFVPLLAASLIAADPIPAAAQCAPATQRLIAERRFDEARLQLQPALAKSAKDDAGLECLGRVSMAMNRAREAVDFFEKSIAINDAVATHHLWLGNALGSIADSTSKIKLPFLARRIKGEFERTVALDPSSIEGRHGLIQFYSQAPGVMGGSMDKAHEQVREIGRLNPMRGHFEAASLAGRDKNVAEMEREYLAAVQAAPDSTIASFTLGSFYQGQQRWNDAFGLYDRMLRQFPAEPNVHLQIGRTAALSGLQLERGEREIGIWLTNPPREATRGNISAAHFRLGNIHEREGKKDMARADYQQALTIDPSNENAKKSLAALK